MYATKGQSTLMAYYGKYKVNILGKYSFSYNKYLFTKHAKKIKNCALSCRIIAKITIGDIHAALGMGRINFPPSAGRDSGFLILLCMGYGYVDFFLGSTNFDFVSIF